MLGEIAIQIFQDLIEDEVKHGMIGMKLREKFNMKRITGDLFHC